MKTIIFFILVFFLLCSLIIMYPYFVNADNRTPLWEVRSIDTMKYSRDLAREKNGHSSFSQEINQQVQQIAQTGATHVAISTPYDSEFLPFLREWVAAARRHHLHVWFRGNWAGWEQWFGYPPITQDDHTQKTIQFITENPDLFQDGDIFTPCPECENGGPGDPRMTGDVEEFRQFIIGEHRAATEAFRKINKNVATNYNSMNSDVAELIMDKPTTQALGGIVTIDDYAPNSEDLLQDIHRIAQKSGGRIVLGEIGAPVPDIHGSMSPKMQADWIYDVFKHIAAYPNVVGVNYWVNKGGTTALWESNGSPRQAQKMVRMFYSGYMVRGMVKDNSSNPLKNAVVRYKGEQLLTHNDGSFRIFIVPDNTTFSVEANGYKSKIVKAEPSGETHAVVLQAEGTNLLLKMLQFFKSLF